MGKKKASEPWYSDGLRFECTKCGACCTGAPGFVWVELEEIEAIAQYRGETVEAFGKQFLRQVGDRISLVEKPGGDCIFWDKAKGCTVYPARPTQCRTWPFWIENIETPDAWEGVCGICPGSGKGKLYSLDEIVDAAARTPS